ncbi:hypothetical protein KR044_010233 [Drosophila immigrans]|nr:hypothetical protein KR044_010233 [Drosophila immigrans]
MLLLVLLLQLFCTIPSQAFVSITKVECTSFNLKDWYFKHCEMKTNSKGETFINIYTAMRNKKTPINDVTINISMFKVTRTYRIPIYNETIDYCAYMRNPVVTNIFSYMYQQFIKFTNANHSCPYEHDIIYYGLEKERFLPEVPAPKGNYIFQWRLAANKAWRVIIKFFVTQN